MKDNVVNIKDMIKKLQKINKTFSNGDKIFELPDKLFNEFEYRGFTCLYINNKPFPEGFNIELIKESIKGRVKDLDFHDRFIEQIIKGNYCGYFLIPIESVLSNIEEIAYQIGWHGGTTCNDKIMYKGNVYQRLGFDDAHGWAFHKDKDNGTGMGTMEEEGVIKEIKGAVDQYLTLI
jgi:hypothetical protein